MLATHASGRPSGPGHLGRSGIALASPESLAGRAGASRGASVNLIRQLMVYQVLQKTLGGKAPDGCLWNVAGEIAAIPRAGTARIGCERGEGGGPVQAPGEARHGANTTTEEDRA